MKKYTKAKIKAEIDQMGVIIKKLINDRDRACSAMRKSKYGSIEYIKHGYDYHYAVNEIDALEKVIADLVIELLKMRCL